MLRTISYTASATYHQTTQLLQHITWLHNFTYILPDYTTSPTYCQTTQLLLHNIRLHNFCYIPPGYTTSYCRVTQFLLHNIRLHNFSYRLSGQKISLIDFLNKTFLTYFLHNLAYRLSSQTTSLTDRKHQTTSLTDFWSTPHPLPHSPKDDVNLKIVHPQTSTTMAARPPNINTNSDYSLPYRKGICVLDSQFYTRDHNSKCTITLRTVLIRSL